MPPVTKAGGDQFRKTVSFVAKDAAEQRATGVVMVPDKADLQQDFAREETIRGFADQFATFEAAGEASGGIMHAAWPGEWMALERNEVLDESETIGGESVVAGAWVQEWQFNDDGLWSLVEDGVLGGYSIGAFDVSWDGPYEPDEVDDVAMPADLPDDALVWELTNGIIREVSAVDIPAVPDAQILQTKEEAAKRLGDYLGDPNGFIDEAMERGATEAEAERMWDVMQRAIEIEGASEPGKQSFFHRIGKAAFGAAFGSGGDDSYPTESTDSDGGVTDKAGRTLSKANRESAMAAIDANLDMLEDSGMDHGMTRFTDRDDVAFDLSEHDAREWGWDEDEDGEDDGDTDEDSMEPRAKDAPDGDTSDDTTTMSDDDPDDGGSDDPWADAPAWAKDLRDSTEQNSKRIDDLADDDADKDAADGDDAWTDAPAWAKALAEEQRKNADRIDAISKQSGYSDQLPAGGEESDDDDSGLGSLGKALS
jgi:hypothetical protein